MLVTISHYEETVGLLNRRKFYGVRTHVEFNQEELAIIKERGLGRYVVMERDVPADQAPDTIGHFALNLEKLLGAADGYLMRTPQHCKAYDATLRLKLAEAKQFIMDNAELGPAHDSFEL